MVAIAALGFWLVVLALTKPRLPQRRRPKPVERAAPEIEITVATDPQPVHDTTRDDLLSIRSEYIAALEEIENALDGLSGDSYQTQNRRITLLTRRANLTKQALKIERELNNR